MLISSLNFNTPTIIIVCSLAAVLLFSAIITALSKKNSKKCSGNCGCCSACSRQNFTYDEIRDDIIIDSLEKKFYKDAIELIKIQKAELQSIKNSEIYLFYKALSYSSSTRAIFYKDTLMGFAILTKDFNKHAIGVFPTLYLKLKELSKPYKEFATYYKQKENTKQGILLIAVDPFASPNKLKELLICE